MIDHFGVRLAAAALSCCLLSCTGIIDGKDEPAGGKSPDTGTPAPGPGPGPNGGTPMPGETPAQVELPKFKVPAQFPVLLPFDVRVSRLLAVVGLPYSDTAF